LFDLLPSQAQALINALPATRLELDARPVRALDRVDRVRKLRVDDRLQVSV
jgi:hypothetical protein